METQTKTPVKTIMTLVKDEILIYLSKEVYIKFHKVFVFNSSPDLFMGHIKIWDDYCPFYFLFNRDCMKQLNIKGYQNCTFILNSFRISYDKNQKMYLRCDPDNGNVMLKYHPITTRDNLKDLVHLKHNGHILHCGFSTSNKYHGEAYEFIYIKK
jgi:hypothetical protein